ncbi:hypothetical protein AX14_002268 [Amanita brunnescens Koide BX004]|nr:hypothetical protein AX14_002268 [Amanita brunnescens Koide BX004]
MFRIELGARVKYVNMDENKTGGGKQEGGSFARSIVKAQLGVQFSVCVVLKSEAKIGDIKRARMHSLQSTS